MKERKHPILLQWEISMTADQDRINWWSSSCCQQWAAWLGQDQCEAVVWWERLNEMHIPSSIFSSQVPPATHRQSCCKNLLFHQRERWARADFPARVGIEGKASTNCSFSWCSLQKMHLPALGYWKSKLWSLSGDQHWKANPNKVSLYGTRVPRIEELAGHS